MTQEKFKGELDSLEKFFTIFCKDKHTNQTHHIQDIRYKEISYTLETNLCEECQELLNYSISRLQNCKYEEKPRCRKCPDPCYDKGQWKKVAKLMKYSGIKLGLSKLKKVFNLKADI